MSLFSKTLYTFLFLSLLWPSASIAAPFVAEPLLSIKGNFNQPSDIAISEEGKIYVLDGVKGRIKVFSNKGKQLTTIKGEKSFKLPMAMAIEGKYLYLADTLNHRIAIFNTNGSHIKNIVLTSDHDSPTPPEPTGIAVSKGDIFWSDRANHRICITEIASGKRIKCFGKKGEGEEEFHFPFMLAFDKDDYLHVVDVLNGRIKYFNARGNYFGDISSFGTSEGTLYRPNGISIEDDNIFISDAYSGKISVFKGGLFSGYIKDKSGKALIFNTPVGIKIQGNRLYVAQMGSNSIEVLSISESHKSSHSVNSSGSTASGRDCITCHLSWSPDYEAEEDKGGELPVASSPMCYSCHHGAVIESRPSIGTGHQHPSGEKRMKPNKKTERKDNVPDHYPLIADKQLYCGSCHTPHEIGREDEGYLGKTKNRWIRGGEKGTGDCLPCHKSKEDKVGVKNRLFKGVNHPAGIILKKPPQGADEKLYASTKALQKGLPKILKDHGAKIDSRKRISCNSCHRAHGTEEKKLVLMKNSKGELCAACHERLYNTTWKEARKKGVHPVTLDLEKPLKLGDIEIKSIRCNTCHSVHNGKKDSPLISRKIQNDLPCIDCHERVYAKNKEEASKKGVHPVKLKFKKAITIGKREIKEMDCLTCHSVHDGKEGTPALIEEYKNGELCLNCHERMKDMPGMDHDLRITAKESKNGLKETPLEAGLCGSCHSMHRGKREASFLYSGRLGIYSSTLKVTNKDILCFECHTDKGNAGKKVIKEFDHPYKDIVLRSKTTILPLFDKNDEKSEFGEIRCVTCHNPHSWSPGKKKQVVYGPPGNNIEGDVLNSFLRRKGAKGTFCVECHGLETRIKYKYYHDKLGRDAGIDYLK
ncbi:MAG: cytochrome c3 family protein [Deltaproteobacteria bacterium]|nr:cytochrome c3 family protein [Deltaproteobacteria bacterium]